MNPLHRLYRRVPGLRRFLRRRKNALVAGLATLALWLVGKLSLERAVRLGEVVGGVLYHVLRSSRRLALDHLAEAFGKELSAGARARLARACFVNVARSFCEIAKIDEIRARRETYFEVQGLEHFHSALARGGGVLAVTGHIGNWELLAAYCAWNDLPIAAVARHIYAEGLNRLLVGFRARQGVYTILRNDPQAARAILRALKSNVVLAMLIDQDTEAPSVSVPFFGRPARTPTAAATWAIRRRMPAVAAFIQRRPQGGHRITIEPPFSIERTGNFDSDVAALTLQFNRALEAHIRRTPEEWVWWHRRWRRPPQPHLDLDAAFPYTNTHLDTVAPARAKEALHGG